MNGLSLARMPDHFRGMAESFRAKLRRPGPAASSEALFTALESPRPLVHAISVGCFVAAGLGSAIAQSSGRPITAAILFLLGVVVAGTLEGVWGGLIAALVASLAYNVFLIEPTFRFSLASIEDYVPIIAFNAGAIASGLLTGRLRDRACIAESSTRRLSGLLRLSRMLQAAVSLPEVLNAVRAFAGATVSVELYTADGARLDSAGPPMAHFGFAETALARRETPIRDRRRAAFILSSLEAPVGVLVFAWMEEPGPDVEGEDIVALVNLVSIAVERCLLLRKVSEAQLVKRSEEFKSTLLSSVSHDLRTPLSAISASVSSLARYGDELPAAAKADMLAMIQEQCQRLDRYTTKLLSLGRLQAGLDSAQFTECDAIEVLGAAIVQARGLGESHEIVKKIERGDAPVLADPVMLEQVFYNVLENSVRYSEPGSRITVSASVRRSHLLVSVRDFGCGVPAGQFERIFDRFYRARGAQSPEGTGLGLAIAKGFTEAFGGRIWAGLPDDPEGGTVVTIELPIAPGRLA